MSAHDARSALLALLAALAAAVAAAPAVAERCEQPCKAETAACLRARCAGLGDTARRDCVETCRGIGGCAPIRTLAWVVTECHSDGQTIRQSLRVRRENCAPVTIMDLELPVPLGEACRRFGDYRLGHISVIASAFQRLGVSPDGSTVVFEVTDEVTLFPDTPPVLPPGIEKGLYVVGADGRGLRRLGPPSRLRLFGIAPEPLSPTGLNYGGLLYSPLDFSLDGRRIVLTDRGPGPAGEDAAQVVIVDLASGRRAQVTRLPYAEPAQQVPYEQAVMYPRFADRDTVLFVSSSNPDGLNPEHAYTFFTVGTDGAGLRAIGTPIASPGGRVDPRFEIAGGGTNLMNVEFWDGSVFVSREVFLLDGKRLLQLTSFGGDNARRFLTVDRRHAFFTSSADPLGTNPSRNCELFSADTIGGRIRQVTHLWLGERSTGACGAALPPGCSIWNAYQDPATREIVFHSSCDPLGANPYGDQIFAMRPDGSKLRQLTALRGRVIEEGGAVSVELAGPLAYSSRQR